MARVFAVVDQVVTVVERQLLARRDVAEGDNPNFFAGRPGFAIRRATVIDESCDVMPDEAVQVVRFVQRKNVFVTGLTAAKRFRFVDFFADVFDNARPGWNRVAGETTQAMNGGVLSDDKSGHSGFRQFIYSL